MNAQYDVIIIGAGNAGLFAGLELVQKGKKVLIVEQHNLAGGCASSFCRGRFEFEPSLHELCDVGPLENPGTVRKLFSQYGINVNWVKLPDCFRIISKYSDGTPMDVTMPCGLDAFKAKLKEYVPGADEKIDLLFELFLETADGLSYLSRPEPFETKVLIKKYMNLLKSGALPTLKVFKLLKLPKKVIDIMSTYWSYLGIDLSRLSFAHYAAMVTTYIVRGGYIPSHTSHELSTAICKRFMEIGGEIWFNCRVDKILFENGRATGVETKAGPVFSRYVIANINEDIVYGKMVPPEVVPDYMKKLSKARKNQYSGRMITAYFGLNKTAEELGIKDYSIFLNESADSVLEYKNMMKSLDDNNFSIFVCQNVVNPDASPKGTAVCSFTTFCDRREWEELSEADYIALKNKMALKFIKSLKDKAGIDISDCIEEASIATPWTFARYVGSPEGSCYGMEIDNWDGMLPRMMTVKNDNPVPGLATAGTSGPRGDGYNSTYCCGQMIAGFVLKKLGGA